MKSPYPYALMLPQSDTERLLEERLGTMGVAVERNTEVTALKFDDAGASASLRRADGTEETVHADWLVGCDGAHSTVRHALGVPFAGETMDSDWILADVHMTRLSVSRGRGRGLLARRACSPIFPISRAAIRVIAELAGCRRRTPRRPRRSRRSRRSSITGGRAGAVAFDPIWLAGFRINGRKVANYRWGRVFLAGDAAHVHSPAGGAGHEHRHAGRVQPRLEAGAGGRGTCDEHLLDSYSPERSAVGDEVLKAAERLTAVGTMRNPVAAERCGISWRRIMLGLGPVQHAFADTMTEVAIGYPDSPLNGPALGGAGPKPGERVEPVAGEVSFGSGDTPRFALLAAPSRAASELIAEFPQLLESSARTPPDAHSAWLIRPDGYVAAVASAEDLGTISSILRQISR